ncbi:MAG: PSD1 domain-containing protein, partial [Cytophagales bacterium]|nr:PSD1 domain-containing protein [Cytophagales bacterium]
MKQFLLPSLLVFTLAVVFTCRQNPKGGTEALSASGARLDFNYHVKPILSDKCFACHGPDPKKRDSGLRLDTEEGAFTALRSDPHRYAIVRGNPGQSELVRRIFSEDPKLRMPPAQSNLTLTEAEKEVLRQWVAQGAGYKKHWAFIPPQRPPLPTVSDAGWPRNPIDRFVLAKLEEKDLRPSPPADKERLLRRVSFDLTGLPPSPEATDAFLRDTAPDAYEKAVDGLLASPAYGERWASYWLDLARYGDTHGYQDDFPRLMWPWRDWVIHAFNQNLPYDRFVTWQLAGDLLPGATQEQILASGFNRNHKITHEGGVIPEEYRTEYVMDRTGTFGKAFLGVSLECARCHDHKYDPLSQKDFYSVYAFFNNVSEVGLDYTRHKAEFVPKPTLAVSYADAQAVLTFINRKSLRPQDTLRVMVMNDDSLRKTFVLNRGQYDLPGHAEVKGNAPAAILPLDTARHGKNRLGLARWLFDPRHPLTGRVMVNRLWQEVFGRGLVVTAEDFGNQGNLPTHPELLDWLAVEFRERGWDIKYMLKRMVTSAAYRQSSVTTPELREADPENAWLARGPRYRLNSEMIRDNVLYSSGLLSREVGGPSVKPYQPEGIWEAIVVG